jgi:U3 small nucleolar RNA-associated protein 7
MDTAVVKKKKDGVVKSMGAKKGAKLSLKEAADQKLQEAAEKYAKGSLDFGSRKSQYKALRKTLEGTTKKIVDAATSAATSEILLPADAGYIEMENERKVYSLKQKEIIENVDMNTAKNSIDLQLHNFGPYNVDYSRNGRYMIFAGRKGHVATFDCLRTTVGTELQLQEDVFDAQYLQNETLFAVAQQKYTYIYDNKGVEIHCMKRHERPYKLDYLPYHFLLTSVGHSGWIKWHDISTGDFVAGYGTGHGPCRVLTHNQSNGVSHLGHSNGIVTLWSPAAGKPLVSLFCHKSPVTAVAVDREGYYMATAGLDGMLKVWDLRKYTSLQSYKLDHPATSLDISDRGLVGIGLGRTVQVLKNAFTQARDVTYLTHAVRTPNQALSSGAGAAAAKRALLSSVKVHSVKFRPLEDLLCAGHTHGVSTFIVPGAGEPNFDSFENNPFSTLKQRREAEVQSLLTKLSHETIALDAAFVGAVEKDAETLQAEHKSLFETANATELKKKEKNRKRGKNKISAKLRRKQKNVIDAQLLKLKEKQSADRAARGKEGAVVEVAEKVPSSAISRFMKK